MTCFNFHLKQEANVHCSPAPAPQVPAPPGAPCSAARRPQHSQWVAETRRVEEPEQLCAPRPRKSQQAPSPKDSIPPGKARTPTDLKLTMGSCESGAPRGAAVQGLSVSVSCWRRKEPWSCKTSKVTQASFYCCIRSFFTEVQENPFHLNIKT